MVWHRNNLTQTWSYLTCQLKPEISRPIQLQWEWKVQEPQPSYTYNVCRHSQGKSLGINQNPDSCSCLNSVLHALIRIHHYLHETGMYLQWYPCIHICTTFTLMYFILLCGPYSAAGSPESCPIVWIQCPILEKKRKLLLSCNPKVDLDLFFNVLQYVWRSRNHNKFKSVRLNIS